MATYTTSQRKGALLGPTIAIKGTSIKIAVIEHSLNYIVPHREVTHVHDTTAASSDTHPTFKSSNQVTVYLRARGYVTGKATSLLAAMKAKTAIAVVASLGKLVLDGDLLLKDATYRTSKKSRFIAVSIGGVLTSTTSETNRA